VRRCGACCGCRWPTPWTRPVHQGGGNSPTLGDQARDLIRALAQIGQRHEPARRAAEAAGLSRAGWTPTQGPRLREDWHEALKPSLGPLDSLRPNAKGTLVATFTHDQQVTVPEAEALRAICAALHAPLPLVPMAATAPR
jgi:hypothetical protein